MSFDPSEEIQQFTIHILILQGDADLQWGLDDAENIKKAKPKAQLLIVKKLSHVLKVVDSLEENGKSHKEARFALSSKLVEHLFAFIGANQ